MIGAQADGGALARPHASRPVRRVPGIDHRSILLAHEIGPGAPPQRWLDEALGTLVRPLATGALSFQSSSPRAGLPKVRSRFPRSDRGSAAGPLAPDGPRSLA